MTKLIEYIKGEVISTSWTNNEGAQFEYDEINNHYRLIKLSKDYRYKVRRLDRNDQNSPIVIKGFIAYLIRNWNRSEGEIYRDYYTKQLDKYRNVESKKPGSVMRNLDAEFYSLHILQEKELIKYSEKIYPYLNNEEIELINQYTDTYLEYIKNKFQPLGIQVLSVPDWCIVFYYLDEAGDKQGHKIRRMEKFIEDNNVVNPKGTLTTVDNFKKEYYEIVNRINVKNNEKPLPPKKIKNILAYLRNDKKAMQMAEENMDFLYTEIKEVEKE